MRATTIKILHHASTWSLIIGVLAFTGAMWIGDMHKDLPRVMNPMIFSFGCIGLGIVFHLFKVRLERKPKEAIS